DQSAGKRRCRKKRLGERIRTQFYHFPLHAINPLDEFRSKPDAAELRYVAIVDALRARIEIVPLVVRPWLARSHARAASRYALGRILLLVSDAGLKTPIKLAAKH